MPAVADPLLDAAIEMITVGAGSSAMSSLLDAAGHVSAAPFSALLMQQEGGHLLLAGRGFSSVKRGRTYPNGPDFEAVYVRPRVFDDAEKLAHIKRGHGLLPWAWGATVPVPLPGLTQKVALVCADTRPNLRRPDNFLARLGLLASIAADQLTLIAMLATQGGRIEGLIATLRELKAQQSSPAGAGHSPANVAAPAAEAVFAPPPEADAVAPSAAAVDFVAATLIKKERLLHRGDVAYHAIRRWRAPVKQWQLAALKALKRTRDPLLIALAADELASGAQQLYGASAIGAVAAVPCGHSGADCLSHRLAIAVAERLGVPSIEFFAPMEVSGSSHPRRNALRPRMRLRQETVLPTLLIDDVATSGAHIAEATRLLRTAAPSVFPLVWLADG